MEVILYMSFSVLIVDDEKMPREILRQYIPWDRFDVKNIYEAEDGLQALETVRQKRPDLIISDIKMPHMNGMDLAQAVRSITPDCRFVFLSGYPDKKYLKEAIKLKAASFVEKPIDLEEINAVLTDLFKELADSLPVDPHAYFFRGNIHACRESPLKKEIYRLPDSFLPQLEGCLKSKDRHNAFMLLSRLYRELKGCEGTPLETVRHIYCQLVFLFLSCAESRNYAAVTRRGDTFLYEAAGLETLGQLNSSMQKLAELYFNTADSDAPDPLTRVNQYIEKNYANPELSVLSMAQDLGFSNTYLCAVYKKSSGRTINQQITQVRLEHSKLLLRSSSLRLYDIAAAVGYTDSNYFTRLFTRELGLSPKEYRERHLHEA